MLMNRYIFLILVVIMGMTACDSPTSKISHMVDPLSGPEVKRVHDPKLVLQGESVFRKHCARCHGQRGEGAPDWRRRDENGLYPPPPLNGTGHAWHHSKEWLKEMILNGSKPRGRMPAWRGKLSDQEVNAVIEWFQSRWPDPVYAAWYENQERARGLKE
jgi:mono/diheme cytochrome c family protein